MKLLLCVQELLDLWSNPFYSFRFIDMTDSHTFRYYMDFCNPPHAEFHACTIKGAILTISHTEANANLCKYWQKWKYRCCLSMAWKLQCGLATDTTAEPGGYPCLRSEIVNNSVTISTRFSGSQYLRMRQNDSNTRMPITNEHYIMRVWM